MSPRDYYESLDSLTLHKCCCYPPAFRASDYLNFIYQYDAGNLRDVSPEALAEFFLDYLLRKVMAKPPEYTHWPPALRLFYRFLADKGYLDEPEPIVAGLYAIEPDFIALVKQRS